MNAGPEFEHAGTREAVDKRKSSRQAEKRALGDPPT